MSAFGDSYDRLEQQLIDANAKIKGLETERANWQNESFHIRRLKAQIKEYEETYTKETKAGDPNISTEKLITYFREYHEGLAVSPFCIDSDCDVISKPYAKIISERLKLFHDNNQILMKEGETLLVDLGTAQKRIKELESSQELRLNVINTIQAQFERATTQFKAAELLAKIAVKQRDDLIEVLEDFKFGAHTCCEANYPGRCNECQQNREIDEAIGEFKKVPQTDHATGCEYGGIAPWKKSDKPEDCDCGFDETVKK